MYPCIHRPIDQSTHYMHSHLLTHIMSGETCWNLFKYNSDSLLEVTCLSRFSQCCFATATLLWNLRQTSCLQSVFILRVHATSLDFALRWPPRQGEAQAPTFVSLSECSYGQCSASDSCAADCCTLQMHAVQTFGDT